MPKRNVNEDQIQEQNGYYHSERKRKRQRLHSSHSNGNSGSENEDSNDEVETSVVSIPSTRLPVKRKIGHEVDPVAGVIKRISVNNFMCHHHLEVALGSHINFVVGRNGSGKSAVLTALVVGLGGKAAFTSRGSSIKNFIMSGKKTAWVEVVLTNKGKDSYKPEVYGDKIIIRRRFTIEGSSTYAIRSATGQHISNRRDELARITDHLNIQVDNPIAILNQDTSRNFLNTKSAGDKFKFFMKATQLEQMNSDYNLVKKSKELTKQIISDKEETLQTMQAEVRDWETKFKNMTAVSELKKKVKLLKNEMAWAFVAQKEQELKPMVKALQIEESALPKFKQKVEEAKQRLNDWEARHKEVEDRLIDCSKEVKDLEPMLQQTKKEVQKAKERLNPTIAQLRTCDRELSIMKRDCLQCKDRIEELKRTASQDYESDRRRREQQIGELEGKLQTFTSKQKVLENDLEQYRSAVAKYKSDLADIETSLKTNDNKLRAVQSTLNTLKAAKNDRLQRFGAYVPAVVEKIKQHSNRFHRVPKGPIGACFDLVEPKWALGIETCLKGLVASFICHDHHDEKLLLSIFQSVCPRGNRPPIITSPFSDRLHNIQNTGVKSDRYRCVLDVLKCDDPVILNTLIDQRTVERVLLIEDSTEARQVMRRSPPTNARECFTIEGDQILCEPTFRYYSSDKTSARFLMADVGEQIKTFEREFNQLSTERAVLVKEREVQHREIGKNQQEEKKCLTQLNKLRDGVNRIHFDIEELKSVEDPVPVDVTTLEEEVSSFQQKIQELQQRREEFIKERDALQEALNQAKDNYSAVEASIRDKSDSGVPLREKISQAQAEVEKARNEMKHYTTKLKEKERQIKASEDDIAKAKRELEADTEKAAEICPNKVITKRTVASVESEISKIQNQIDKEEQEHGNEREVIEIYSQKKQTYDKVWTEVAQLKKYVERLDKGLEARRAKYLQMRKDIAARTRYYFIVQMHQRSYKGKMSFDFEKQTLDIHVNPSQDVSDKGRMSQPKDLKSLSGGERSFSTVCFILSLWEAMESPFRCLDEFDVFMDMVNRRISMQLIMEAAKMHKDMQFVFLTPQELSHCKEIEKVNIFRMPDPERSQKSLNFTSSQEVSFAIPS